MHTRDDKYVGELLYKDTPSTTTETIAMRHVNAPRIHT